MHKLTFILLIIGGLNWLAFGLTGYDVGSLLGGMSSVLSRIIYILVGLSAIYEIIKHTSVCKNCDVAPKA